MEKPIIEVKSIGKRYKITHERGKYIALRDVIANTLKHPFAFLMDKAKSATGLKKKEEFWALRDVNFTVKRGEVVGIIGHNGAGKSTLLKILSQITPPTEGEIILRGRVGSLLEVGTGFHPELTGRENIFLNGAILGMTRREMSTKFDEIVEFSGIEKFLDTPVKYYSSGMYVRLAFSVAAHMEPDILVVDEVLAVGDAEFQKKCLGKMDEITKKEGRTILFVSHNLSAIQQLCDRTILLEKGRIKILDETEKVVSEYQNLSKPIYGKVIFDQESRNRKFGSSILKSIEVANQVSIHSLDKLQMTIEYSAHKPIDNPQFCIVIKAINGMRICTMDSSREGNSLPKTISGSGKVTCIIPELPLLPGKYQITLMLWQPGEKLDEIENALTITVLQDGNSRLGQYDWNKLGVIYMNAHWKH